MNARISRTAKPAAYAAGSRALTALASVK